MRFRVPPKDKIKFHEAEANEKAPEAPSRGKLPFQVE